MTALLCLLLLLGKEEVSPIRRDPSLFAVFFLNLSTTRWSSFITRDFPDEEEEIVFGSRRNSPVNFLPNNKVGTAKIIVVRASKHHFLLKATLVPHLCCPILLAPLATSSGSMVVFFFFVFGG